MRRPARLGVAKINTFERVIGETSDVVMLYAWLCSTHHNIDVFPLSNELTQLNHVALKTGLHHRHLGGRGEGGGGRGEGGL